MTGRFCHQCGRPIEADANFCGACGTPRLVVAETEPPVARRPRRAWMAAVAAVPVLVLAGALLLARDEEEPAPRPKAALTTPESTATATATATAPKPKPKPKRVQKRAPFIVPTRASEEGFGPFRGGEVADLRRAFGKPSSVTRRRRRESQPPRCALRWARLGMHVQVRTYGEGDPCKSGGFERAKLTDSRWRTASGVRPGVSAARARRVSVRFQIRDDRGERWLKRCTIRACGTRGYALGRMYSEPGGLHTWTVVARVRGGRVDALVVQTHTSE